MKKYLIVLLVLMTCNLMSDNVEMVWFGNAENENVMYYLVYKVEDNDSTNLNLVLVDSVFHINAGQEHFYVTTFNSNYIKGGVRAVNANGAAKNTSKTRAFSRGELALPSATLMASPAFRLLPFLPFGQATKLIDYGFEDYTGNVETTPGYIFTSSASSYWNDHIQSTEVVSLCNGLSAHTGTYYIHQNFYTGASDVCLGGAPSSVNDHGNVGGNFTYPTTAFGDNTDFQSEITGDTLVIRFYLRTQGNWSSVGPGGKCKFTRTYGTGGSGDNASLITHYTISDNRLQIYDPSTLSYGTGIVLSSNLYNGSWHAMAIRIVINNHNNSNGNITASVWWDNYDMTGSADLVRTVTCPTWGAGFFYFDFWQNWSATYPSGSMGIDLDDIEVWDGMPNGRY